MKVNNQLVEKIAELAKLEFNESAKQKMIEDMNKILFFIDKLDELNVEELEPLIYLTKTTNVLRSDEEHQHEVKGDVLKNAPAKDSDYFKVPKVLKKTN